MRTKEVQTVLMKAITGQLLSLVSESVKLPLLNGLSSTTILQNSAARVLTKTGRQEHITPVLKSLHWLPVCFKIHFKILLLVFKCLNGLGPTYLSDLLLLTPVGPEVLHL